MKEKRKASCSAKRAADQEGAVKAGARAAVRKQAETIPRNVPANLQTLVDNMQQGILFASGDRRILFANQSFCDLFGISSPGAILGADCALMTEQAKRLFTDPEGFPATIERRLAERRTVLSEELSLVDGRTMERDYIPVMMSGKQTGNYWIYRDVTERKLAESRVRESEDRFRSIFEQVNDGIMIADPEQKKNIEANRAICAMLGYTRDELVGLSVADMHPKEDLPRVLGLFEQQARGELSLAPDVPMVRKDGSVVYADVNAARRTLDGKQCLIGVFRDITKRKKMEASLRAREKQLAESQRIAHIGSWEHNLTTGRVFWSDELFRLFGLDPGKDPGDFKLFFDMVHPDDQPALKKAIDETVRSRTHFNIDYRFIRKDGVTRILHAQAEIISDATGTQTILSGTGQDITERKRAEETIRQSEEFIRSVLDTVDEGFIVIDRDHRILTANKAYCGQVGLSCDEVIGRHCYEVSHKTNRPCYEDGEDCAVRDVFATGEPHTALHKHTDRDGHLLYVETKGYPIKGVAGNVVSVIETVNNITEKHLLEEERLKTQKLESIGTLAGGIAHDFNNLLQGIFGYISVAKMTADRKDKTIAMLEQAENALHLSVNLTTQLLTFSKGGKPVKKLTDLRPVIENSTRFTLSGSRSDFRMNIPEDLWQAEVDDGQVGQVIQNIVLNADQSMPQGGSVIVTAKNAAKGDAALPSGLAKGNYVMVSVRDSGIGIPEEHIGKIFDPYFTTKEQGSGLGLATSYSIVRNHGGLIDVRSKPGEGSTFTIYLPAMAGMDRTESKVKPQELSRPRKARVLIMDDEDIIRRLSSELLGALGHDVEVAKHGQEALEKYREAMTIGKPFDVVILDLTIRGGMGGAETMQKLRELDPAVKAIVSSGYSEDAESASYLSYGFKAYLKKPYDMTELGDILNSLLV